MEGSVTGTVLWACRIIVIAMVVYPCLRGLITLAIRNYFAAKWTAAQLMYKEAKEEEERRKG